MNSSRRRSRLARPATMSARAAALAAVLAAGVLLSPAASTTGAAGAPTVPAGPVHVSAPLLPHTTTLVGNPADYSFLKRNLTGTPGRWNPCRTLTWRVNADGAPASGGTDIAEALRRISLVTGITFVRAGRTSVVPQHTRDRLLPRRGFEHFDADLIVAYPTATMVPALAGAVAGLGGAEYYSTASGWQISHGYALVDRASLAGLKDGFGTGVTKGHVMMHELGHALGLGHAAARPQLMYGAGSFAVPATWQAGDRTGLTKVGRRAGCMAALPAGI